MEPDDGVSGGGVDRLPADSDTEVDDTPAGAVRPSHLRWSHLGLVAAGGALGTAGREALSLAHPAAAGGFPVTTFLINAVGAFLLGFLLEYLTRGGPDEGHRRSLRLLLGTGVLGGFTTYSALATDTAVLTSGSTGLAFGYAAATLVVGVVASTVGIAAGSALPAPGSRAVGR